MSQPELIRKGLTRRTLLKGLGAAAGVATLRPLWAHGQSTIKIGLMTPQSIVFGEGMTNGARMAVDEINAAGGVLGQQLELVIGNTQTDSDPTVAVSVYQSLAGQTSAILGLFRSEMVQAILPQVPQQKKPTLIVGSTSFGTDRVKTDYNNFKYLFRSVIVNTYSLVIDHARYAGDHIQQLVNDGVFPNKNIVLIGEQLSSSQLFLSLVGPLLAQQGFNVNGPVLIPTATAGTPPNLGPVISQLQSLGANLGLTFFSDPTLSVLFPSAVAQAKLKLALFGINAPFQSDAAVQASQGAATGYVIADFSADAPVTAKTKAFFGNYQTKFGKRAVYTSGTTYDSVYVLVEAIRKANGTNADALISALETTNYIGAGGPVRYYDKNEPVNPNATITITTKAGEFSIQNSRNLGVIILSLLQSHDTIYGLNEVPNNNPTAFDGVRPVFTQVRADGSRPVLYPVEFAEGNKYELPPYYPK